MVADAERLLRVLLYQHDGKPLFIELLYDLKHLLNYDRRKTERRLIKHHKLRARHHTSADSKHLLLTAGEQTAVLLFTLFKSRKDTVDTLNVFLDAVLILPEIASDTEVFIHGELCKYLPCLRNLHKTRLDNFIRLL